MSAGDLIPLVVNADDFGLTPGVCEAILVAGERGIVSSTSALVVAPAFTSWAERLRDSGLGVGLHVALVGEDPPLLSQREIPTLVSETGRLAPGWKAFCARAARGAVATEDIEREARAQMEALTATGVTVTHVDSHQNLHLWPTVAEVVTKLSQESGSGTRMPRTRRWSPTAVGVRSLGALLARRAARAGVPTAAASVGLDQAGTWTTGTLCDELERLADQGPRSVEVDCHPGTEADPDRARYEWGYRWADELDALVSKRARDLVARRFELVTMAGLGAEGQP